MNLVVSESNSNSSTVNLLPTQKKNVNVKREKIHFVLSRCERVGQKQVSNHYHKNNYNKSNFRPKICKSKTKERIQPKSNKLATALGEQEREIGSTLLPTATAVVAAAAAADQPPPPPPTLADDMAFSRHNIEKHRLIELVRLNPILWDCRLPHYKRSDKKKAVKWNELGRVFRVNGERVQRTFTSLREIFRRELNHEKLLGTRFKSKWEYYEAMAFLKEVIRERKSRERGKSESFQQANCSASNGIDEYQYFAPNDPNNPNNQLVHQQQQVAPPSQQQIPQPQSTVAVQQQHHQQQQQQQQQQLLQLQPDVILNVNPQQLQQQLTQLQNISANVLQQQQQLPDILSSTNSGSSSPSIYIKDEPDSQDETISVSTTEKPPYVTTTSSSAAAAATAAPPPIAANVTTTALAGAPPITTTSSYRQKPNSMNINSTNNINNNNFSAPGKLQKTPLVQPKQRAAGFVTIADDIDCDVDDIDDLDDDELDDDLDADDIDDIVAPATAADGRLSAATTVTLRRKQRRRRISPREILYTKFGDFLAARLNTLNETIANELMNKILMLIAEK